MNYKSCTKECGFGYISIIALTSIDKTIESKLLTSDHVILLLFPAGNSSLTLRQNQKYVH